MIYMESKASPEDVSNSIIPAIFTEDKVLHFRQNGISAKFFSDVDFEKYDQSAFSLFTEVPYLLGTSGEYCDVPYFVRDMGSNKDPELWQLFYCFNKKGHKEDRGKLLYSVLKQCTAHTTFCTCNNCGKKFVVTASHYKYYKGKDLVVPVNR